MPQEKFWNVPNAITTIRLISTFVIIYLILANVSFIIVGIVFVVFALSDALDGNLARKLKQKTKIGAKLDQISDRIYFVGIAITLYFTGEEQISSILLLTTIPKIYLLLIISREIIGLPAFIYLLSENKEFVKVRTIGKITTVFQAITMTWLILKMPFIIYPIIATSIFGIVAGLSYCYDVAKARPIKYLKKKIEERREKKKKSKM